MPDWLWVGGWSLSAVEVATPAPAIGLGPELALQLHEAPDPGAVGADIRLNVGRQLAEGGQVNAEQLRAPLQRRRDRPAQVWVVPGPHRARISNISSGVDRERYVVRRWAVTACAGRAGAATRRNLGDNRGQQGITKPTGQRPLSAIELAYKAAGVSFHAAEAAESRFR